MQTQGMQEWTKQRSCAGGAPTKATTRRMTLTNYRGQSVMNIALVLAGRFSPEQIYFILTTEDPLEQMSQGKSRIGLVCA